MNCPKHKTPFHRLQTGGLQTVDGEPILICSSPDVCTFAYVEGRGFGYLEQLQDNREVFRRLPGPLGAQDIPGQ